MLVYKDDNFQLIHGDYREIKLSEQVDLTVTSPPYNVGIDYGEHEDTQDYREYLQFTTEWLDKLYAETNESGRLCINVSYDSHLKGRDSETLAADITSISKFVGWKYKGTIIWNKHHATGRMATGSVFSANAPSWVNTSEVILVFYKEKWSKGNTKGVSTITKDEWWTYTDGMWEFAPASSKTYNHPASFPIELPNRCIRFFSFETDLIFDPFVGVGTTVVAAAINGRRAIGVDLDLSYLKKAHNRLLIEGGVAQTKMEF